MTIFSCKELTTNLFRTSYLRRAETLRKIISGGKVSLHFPRRSLSSGASQYFWKLNHEEICGVDHFTAPVLLQDTTSQHCLDNFYVSENTEEKKL